MAKMKKRKDGRYQKNVYVGVDENGKRKYKSVFGKTQAEVNQKADEIKLRVGKGMDVLNDNMTFGKLKTLWLTYKKPLLKEHQYKNYKNYLSHFAELDDKKILKLVKSDFQSVINALAEKNPTTGKPTAKKTLREIRAAARQVFDFAIDNRILNYNPLTYVDIPKDAPTEERRALTEQEQYWVLTTEHRCQLPAMIMMLAGLRLSECCGLQWCDIDLKNKIINVHQKLIMKAPAHIEQGAKSKAGIRKVDIPNVLVDFLNKQPAHEPQDYVIKSVKGNLMTDTAWRRLWNSYMADLNIKYGDFSAYDKKPKSKFDRNGVPFVIKRFTAHCLRHTCATNHFYAGHDLMYVQNQLGHSKPETTLNIYTHYVKTLQRKDSKVISIDDFVKGIKKSQMKKKA